LLIATPASVNPTKSSPVNGAVKRLKRCDIPTPSLKEFPWHAATYRRTAAADT